MVKCNETGARGYSPQTGRFYSFAPLGPRYPWYTPYQFAGNTPIWAIDLDGLEELRFTESFHSLRAKIQVLVLNSSYLYGVYQSISRPDRREESLIYFVVKKAPEGILYWGRENGETYEITNYIRNILYYESQNNLSDEDYIRLMDLRIKVERLGLNINNLKKEMVENPDRKIYAVSLTFENRGKVLSQAKTLAHEVIAHLQNNLDGVDKSEELEHSEYTGISIGSKKYLKFQMDKGYTPAESEFEDGSPGKIVNQEIDKAHEILMKNEKLTDQ